MEWLRWYHGACSDDKWPLIAKKAGVPQAFVVAVWAMLLEVASQDEDRGSIEEFDPEAADALMGMPDGSSQAILDALSSGKKPRIVDGCISSWTKRQPKREREDDSAERVRRCREKKRLEAQKNANETPACDYVTPCNANETPVQRQETPRTEQRREENINTPPLSPPPGDAKAGLAGAGEEASPCCREEESCPAPCSKHEYAEEHDEGAKPLKSWPDIEFVQLLDAYPAAKRDEASSWAAWRGLRKAKYLPGINTLLHAVSEWEDSEQWQKSNGQFIPLLSNWLQKRRFSDHPPRAAPENGFPSEDELNAAAEKMRTLGVAS